jgi:hypothetical protein
MRKLFFGLAVVASASALLLSSTVAASAVDVQPRNVGIQTVEKVVTVPAFYVNFLTPVPIAHCPADAPYLNSHEYHPGSGWRIPRGLELVVTDGYGNPTSKWFDADIIGFNGNGNPWGQDSAVGGAHSTVTRTTFDEQRIVTLKLHCTTTP